MGSRVPIYVINLDRSPERLAHVRAQLDGLGLAWERLAAVDGRRLDDGTGRAAQAPLSAAEAGCFQSHVEAWRRIAAREADFGVVLEDDVIVHPALCRLLDCLDAVPPGIDLVKLDTAWRRVHLGPVEATCGPAVLRRLLSRHVCTGGYLVRRSAVPDLLRRARPMTAAVDHVLFDPNRPDAPAAWQACPAPVVAAFRLDDRPVFASLITGGRTRTRERPPRAVAGRLVAEARRLGGRVLLPLWARLRRQRVMRVPFADGRTRRGRGPAGRRACDPRQADAATPPPG